MAWQTVLAGTVGQFGVSETLGRHGFRHQQTHIYTAYSSLWNVRMWGRLLPDIMMIPRLYQYARLVALQTSEMKNIDKTRAGMYFFVVRANSWDYTN